MIYLKPSALFLCLFFLMSCATYYEVNYEFNRNFELGNLQQAEKVLDNHKKISKGKAQFLYFANQGVVNAMTGDLEESNEWFEKAYQFGENYHKNYANVAASLLVNPNTITYQGEDHEHLLLLYYKAINLMKMKEYESALIECRRLINRLNELSDKYKSDKKYRQDAFIHNLMGIIYEAQEDYNNAFIAYRNAYNIYENDYRELFGMEVPRQLKVDLLRAAALTGFYDQLDFYERKFDMKYTKQPADGELVFFWHNGLGPVKDEWSVNFAAVDGGNGVVSFVNEDYDLTFPYAVSSADQKTQITDLRVFRVAFPKYVERKPYFDQAILISDNMRYPLELAEDVNKIAFKTLEERMFQEFGKGLLRVAVKKSVEMAIRGPQISGDDKEKTKDEKQEEAVREGISMLVGLVNAVTEKADTRNWQTIPHGIFYTRVPLEAGKNTVTLKAKNSTNGSATTETFAFDIVKGETVFHTFQSLETKQ